VRRVAHANPSRGVREKLDHAVVRRLLDEDAAACAAVLTAVVEDRVRRAGGELLEVGVGEHDVRALAAQLEADLFQVSGGQPHDLVARGRLIREVHLADTGMRRNGRPRRPARYGDAVVAARRETGREGKSDAQY